MSLRLAHRARSAPADSKPPVTTGSEGDGATAGHPNRRRRWVVFTGLIVAVGGLAAAVLAWPGGDSDGSSGNVVTATATAPVVRRDLVRTESFDGELGFGAPRILAAGRGGVVTSVPDAGGVIEASGTLFSVDTEPTVLLRGDLPPWRALDVDSQSGADIRQLEDALVALGYGTGLTVDETFTAATAAAVAAWEADLGRPVPDGRVEFGDVVFGPQTLRVASVETDLGSTVEAGTPVLSVTPTTKVVTVALEADRAGLVAVGDGVTIELPDDTTTTGTVARVADAAVARAGQGDGESDAEATVPVTIALTDAAAADAFDTASVTVEVTRDRREGVLAVPVTALLALAEGGYAVQVPDAGEPRGYRLVVVEPGLFANDWVEVTGPGLTEGTEVVVAQ